MTIDGEILLSQLEKEIDLGVIVDNNLTFVEHMNDKISKADKFIGAVRRSFIHPDKNMFWESTKHSCDHIWSLVLLYGTHW